MIMGAAVGVAVGAIMITSGGRAVIARLSSVTEPLVKVAVPATSVALPTCETRPTKNCIVSPRTPPSFADVSESSARTCKSVTCP